MTPHEMSVICRFSRDGHIPWQSVAVMLGRDRASLKAEFDSLSMVPITLDPPNLGPVTELPEPECYRSTRAKSDLRTEIMNRLAIRPETAETLASRIGKPRDSVRVRLNEMRNAGTAQSDGSGRYTISATWSLTVFGREVWSRERQERAA